MINVALESEETSASEDPPFLHRSRSPAIRIVSWNWYSLDKLQDHTWYKPMTQKVIQICVGLSRGKNSHDDFTNKELILKEKISGFHFVRIVSTLEPIRSFLCFDPLTRPHEPTWQYRWSTLYHYRNRKRRLLLESRKGLINPSFSYFIKVRECILSILETDVIE